MANICRDGGAGMPQPPLSEAHLLSAAFSKLRSGCASACMENHNTPSPTALRRVEYVEHLKHPEHLKHMKHCATR